MKTSKKLFYLTAILMIAGFEIFIFYEALNPKVNNHYRLYYIENALATWSQGKGIKYLYGTQLNHLNIQPHLSKTGWSIAEETHRWTNGKTAKLLFEVDTMQQCRGLLSLKITTLGEQEIKLTINERFVGSQIVDSEDALLRFEFDPKIIQQNSIITVRFEFPNARKPDSDDIRKLAMALKLFALE